METINLKMSGISELSYDELTEISGGRDGLYRAGQLIGYGLGFMVGGVFAAVYLLL